jgi:hypothetical protein
VFGAVPYSHHPNGNSLLRNIYNDMKKGIHPVTRPVRLPDNEDLLWDIVTWCWSRDPVLRPQAYELLASLHSLMNIAQQTKPKGGELIQSDGLMRDVDNFTRNIPLPEGSSALKPSGSPITAFATHKGLPGLFNGPPVQPTTDSEASPTRGFPSYHAPSVLDEYLFLSTSSGTHPASTPLYPIKFCY